MADVHRSAQKDSSYPAVLRDVLQGQIQERGAPGAEAASSREIVMKANFHAKDVKAIRHNRMIHDRIAQNYDATHIEIHNPIEQKRINQSLQEAISFIKTGSAGVYALDYGAGTGNITKHLLNFGFDVTAADVSFVSLKQMATKLGNANRLQIDTLNGADLSNYKDNTFDLVTSYSVLHHVPDYLAIVNEFIRVVKPGGIVYIDHEVCSSYWEANQFYQGYLEELGEPFRQSFLLVSELPDDKKRYSANLIIRLKRALSKGWLTGSLLRKLNLIYDEGDIHTTKDDHIEWKAIKSRLSPACEILLDQDYLVCREGEDLPPVWTKWRDRCADMKMLVARKMK